MQQQWVHINDYVHELKYVQTEIKQRSISELPLILECESRLCRGAGPAALRSQLGGHLHVVPVAGRPIARPG
jgi:hypothetical protein